MSDKHGADGTDGTDGPELDMSRADRNAALQAVLAGIEAEVGRGKTFGVDDLWNGLTEDQRLSIDRLAIGNALQRAKARGEIEPIGGGKWARVGQVDTNQALTRPAKVRRTGRVGKEQMPGFRMPAAPLGKLPVRRLDLGAAIEARLAEIEKERGLLLGLRDLMTTSSTSTR